MPSRLGSELALLRRYWLDLFFPPRCVICRNANPEWFCPACRSQMTRIAPPICSRCGRPLHRPTCPYCDKSPLRIDGIRAVAFFDGNLRAAIHEFKYARRPQLAGALAWIMADYIEASALPADVLAPVPLHPDRERSRGYNQAQLLAKALSATTGLSMMMDGLWRIRPTRTQTDLDSTERRANVAGAFQADARVAGRRVLLIDDVCTTGATLDACGAALKEGGAKSVWGLALARGR